MDVLLVGAAIYRLIGLGAGVAGVSFALVAFTEVDGCTV